MRVASASEVIWARHISKTNTWDVATMYLINIETLELEEFIEGQIPSYAILSHRWGPEELNFKEVLKKRIDETKRGYKKFC